MTPENKTIVQIAEDCLRSARGVLKRKGARYPLSDTYTKSEGIEYVLRCLADPDIVIAWRVVLLSQKVQGAAARGDVDGVGVAAFRLAEAVMGSYAMETKRKAGRKEMYSQKTIRRRHEELLRTSPAMDPIPQIMEEFCCSRATAYRLMKR